MSDRSNLEAPGVEFQMNWGDKHNLIEIPSVFNVISD